MVFTKGPAKAAFPLAVRPEQALMLVLTFVFLAGGAFVVHRFDAHQRSARVRHAAPLSVTDAPVRVPVGFSDVPRRNKRLHERPATRG